MQNRSWAVFLILSQFVMDLGRHQTSCCTALFNNNKKKHVTVFQTYVVDLHEVTEALLTENIFEENQVLLMVGIWMELRGEQGKSLVQPYRITIRMDLKHSLAIMNCKGTIRRWSESIRSITLLLIFFISTHRCLY